MKAFSKKSLSLLVLGLTGAVACGTFVGCGSDDDNTTGTPDGGTTIIKTDGGTTIIKTDGGLTTGDGSVTPITDSGTDSGPVDAGPQYFRTGSVTLSQTKTSAVTYSTSAFASFAQSLAGAAASTCTVTHVNSACTLNVCTAPVAVDAGADAGDAGTPPEAPQAGTITLTDTTTAFPAAVTLTPSTTTGYYSFYSPPTANAASMFFTKGDSIGFAAGGGTVGAFTSTVMAPADLTSTTPAVSPTTFMFPAFSRGSDLAVSWVGASQGSSVTVSLSTSPKPATGAIKSLSCKFDGFGGMGTVPSAGGLASLDDADGTTFTGSMSISPSASTTTWGTVNGVDAGETADASNQDFLVTTTVNGTAVAGSYTNSN